jgi:hypothetical protein
MQNHGPSGFEPDRIQTTSKAQDTLRIESFKK